MFDLTARPAWLRAALLVFLSLFVGLRCPAAYSSAAGGMGAADGARPNIVLILVDDAALMDFGAYGGEAQTPHIDRLAAQGVRFTRFHTSPLCAPSRAMLLTGLDSHLTGVATIPEVLPPQLEGKPGYSMHLEPGIQTVASRLKSAGYRTLMTGKWHLGHGPGDLPDAHGFDRSYALDASGADNWEQKPYMPYYLTADWFEDGRPAQLPDDFYSSAFLVDRLIAYIDEGRESEQPFFAYLAFQAIHIPIQAPRTFTDRYSEAYAGGWEVLRRDRWRRASEVGLIPPGAPLAPTPPVLRRWETLTPEQQALSARSMAVNAGMLEAMDLHIGRLLDYLRNVGLYRNTIFIVSSDNGPEPSDPLATRSFRTWMDLNGYTHQLATLGEKGSYAFIGPEWAYAAASPSSLFKFYTAEGGLRAPLILSGPGIPSGRTVDALSFVTDVTPTLLHYAGVPGRGDEFTGRSLRPVVTGEAQRVYADDEAVGMEVSGNAALFKGDWKLVWNAPPWGAGSWQLFNLDDDPGETRDLAAAEPQRLAELKRDYDAYASAVGVLEMPAGYELQDQINKNVVAQQLKHYRWLLVLGGLLILGLAFLVLRRLTRVE